MNTLTKFAVVCTAITSLGLVACQSTSTVANDGDRKEQPRGERGHKHHKHGDKPPRMTEEQRKAFDEQIQQACNGKIGQKVNFTVGTQTMQGTCEVRFEPNKSADHKPPFAGKFDDKKQPPKDKNGKMKHPSEMTEAEKAEHEKMRAEHEQQRQAFDAQMQQACNGKIGQKTTITLNGKSVEGTCKVVAKPDMPQRAQGDMPPPPTQK